MLSPSSTEIFQSIHDEEGLKRVCRQIESDPTNIAMLTLFKGTVVDLIVNQVHLLDTLITELCHLVRVFRHDVAMKLWCWKTSARAFAQHYEDLHSDTVLAIINCIRSVCL